MAQMTNRSACFPSGRFIINSAKASVIPTNWKTWPNMRAVKRTNGTRFAAAAAPLVHGGAVVMAWPGTPFLYAGFPLFDGADELTVDGAFRAARDGARAGAGSFVLEAAPAWAKRGRDVFGEPPPALSLMRSLKERFDPEGVLNPGRFVGGI